MHKFKQISLYIALFSFWLLQTIFYIYNQDFSVLSLSDRYPFRAFSNSTMQMNQGDVLSASFKSRYPNLGIIQVRFNTFKRINDDQLTFRIKEKGNSEWFYQANYKSDQFQNGKLFPFGFPLIKDSENKEYEFEIISISGTNDDHVGPGTSFPSFVAKHIYTKNLFNNKNELLTFIVNKSFNILSDPDVLIHTFIYLIPLLLSIYFKNFIKLKIFQRFEKLNKFKRFITYHQGTAKIIVLLSIIIEAVTSELSSGVVLLSVLLFWIFTIRKYKLEYRMSASISGYLMVLVPFLMVFEQYTAAEKMFEWIFVFFTIGVLQLSMNNLLSWGKNTFKISTSNLSS